MVFLILSTLNGNVEHERSIPLRKVISHVTSLAKTLQLSFNLIFPLSFSLFKLVFPIISYPYVDMVLFFSVFGTIDVAKINNVFVLPSFVVCSCMYVLSI